MLGVGEELCEAAGDAHAVLARLLVELRQLLGQLSELWRRGRHGQRGKGEVVVMHQFPAALHALSSQRELKQKALYRGANVRNWTEKHQ